MNEGQAKNHERDVVRRRRCERNSQFVSRLLLNPRIGDFGEIAPRLLAAIHSLSQPHGGFIENSHFFVNSLARCFERLRGDEETMNQNRNRNVNPKSKASLGSILCLVLACAGCGGESKEDFSKPLVMPKAPPVPVEVKPEWAAAKAPVAARGQQPAATAETKTAKAAPSTETVPVPSTAMSDVASAKVDVPKAASPTSVPPTVENAPVLVAKSPASPEMKDTATTTSVSKNTTDPKVEVKSGLEPLTIDERNWLYSARHEMRCFPEVEIVGEFCQWDDQ